MTNTGIKKRISVILVFIIFILFCKQHLIFANGSSMINTIKNGDMLYYSTNDKLKRFDIVVISLDDKIIIKRIIGIPDEEVQISDDKIYINNTVIKNPYSIENNINDSGIAKNKITLGKDEYFVIGDNINNSKDSRCYGVISKKRIIGKCRYIVFPIWHFHCL